MQGHFVLCHLFRKGPFDDIKDDKIHSTDSSVITTYSSYADPQNTNDSLVPNADPSDLAKVAVLKSEGIDLN
jgi:hypothetical protein